MSTIEEIIEQVQNGDIGALNTEITPEQYAQSDELKKKILEHITKKYNLEFTEYTGQESPFMIPELGGSLTVVEPTHPYWHVHAFCQIQEGVETYKDNYMSFHYWEDVYTYIKKQMETIFGENCGCLLYPAVHEMYEDTIGLATSLEDYLKVTTVDMEIYTANSMNLMEQNKSDMLEILNKIGLKGTFLVQYISEQDAASIPQQNIIYTSFNPDTINSFALNTIPVTELEEKWNEIDWEDIERKMNEAELEAELDIVK